jgi:hypothetical protein
MTGLSLGPNRLYGDCRFFDFAKSPDMHVEAGIALGWDVLDETSHCATGGRLRHPPHVIALCIKRRR